MAHLSRWMAAHDLELNDLRGVQTEQFIQERRATGRARLASPRALVPLLGHLRGIGVVPPAASRNARTPAGALVDRYAEYLLVGRGLAAETVRCYCNTARAFLADRERVAGDLGLGALDVAAINAYLLGASQRGSVSSSKAVVTGLRSLLCFLHLDGLIDRDLAVAVPSVAQWRLASLVKALDAATVTRLLDSCDRDAAIGRRDFAILMLLSRLGLRIGEVAGLRLEHLDWRAGELVVCGKGSREERLPLPVDVGGGIVRLRFACSGFATGTCPSRVTVRSLAGRVLGSGRSTEVPGDECAGAARVRLDRLGRELLRGRSRPRVVVHTRLRDDLGRLERRHATVTLRRASSSVTSRRPAGDLGGRSRGGDCQGGGLARGEELNSGF
ncbi:MAG: tyrosine-type recombinase/integrase [Solirubrobacteraceae bacterium]